MVTRRSAEMQRRKRNAPLTAGKVFKALFVLVGVVFAVAIGCVVAFAWKYMKDIPDLTMVEKYEPIEAIQIFDRNDHLICTVEGDQDRRVVPLNQISPQMQQAMLAAEDHHFFEHHGINFVSIGRASLVNLTKGHVVEGGSTITQQLIKNLFFTDAQRTMDRKVKEALMAWEIEQKYTKEKILEMYLNQVFFGNNAYGIERAASRYFDRSAAELDLAQAAFLAGLVKAPSELGAPANRKAALERQHEIIDKMVEYGYITETQGKLAMKEKLNFKRGVNPMQKFPYYISAVLDSLRDHFSQSEMRQQGLRVYTNLDPIAQQIAESSLNADLKKAPKGVSQAALVSVNVPDGAVVALVGGVGDFWKHQFNRATNPHTAGSSFKPFVYLTAFIKGVLTPDSIIDDTPLVVKQPYGLPDYAPKNFDHKFMGRIPIRKAIAFSRNVCSVRITQLVGVDSVIETARLAGITTKLEPNLSLALGSSAVTPLEMAGAYATFARMGVAIKPQLLRKIENNRGQIVEVFEQKVDKVFQVEPVANLVEIMQGVVMFGTGTGAKLDDRPVAGKTGTADESKDIWFVGFTPDLCTAVWGGNDENLPIPGRNVTGGDVMAKIWKHYVEAYYDAHPTPAGSFVAPTGELKLAKDKADADKSAAGDQDNKKPNIDTSPTVVPVNDSGVTVEPVKDNTNPEALSKPAEDNKPGEPVQLRPLPGPTMAPVPAASAPNSQPQSPPPAGTFVPNPAPNYGGGSPQIQAPVPNYSAPIAPAYSPRGYNAAPAPYQQPAPTIMMKMGDSSQSGQGGRLYPAAQPTRYTPVYTAPHTDDDSRQAVLTRFK
ncbi:MAG TPA: PBP1A family penicillin-binding protein [Oculatellaceae cyanobacterium]